MGANVAVDYSRSELLTAPTVKPRQEHWRYSVSKTLTKSKQLAPRSSVVAQVHGRYWRSDGVLERLYANLALYQDLVKGHLLDLGDTLGVWLRTKGSPGVSRGSTSRLATGSGVAKRSSSKGTPNPEGGYLSPDVSTATPGVRVRRGRYNPKLDEVVPPMGGYRDWDSPYDDPLFPQYALQVASGSIAVDPSLPVDVTDLWGMRRIVIENVLGGPLSEKEWTTYKEKWSTTDQVADEVVHRSRSITTTQLLAKKLSKTPEQTYTDPRNLERLAQMMSNIPDTKKRGKSTDKKARYRGEA